MSRSGGGEQISRIWRLSKELYQTQGSNCPGCGTLHFPARQVCPDCGLTTPSIKSFEPSQASLGVKVDLNNREIELSPSVESSLVVAVLGLVKKAVTAIETIRIAQAALNMLKLRLTDSQPDKNHE